MRTDSTAGKTGGNWYCRSWIARPASEGVPDAIECAFGFSEQNDRIWRAGDTVDGSLLCCGWDFPHDRPGERFARGTLGGGLAGRCTRRVREESNPETGEGVFFP